jgi:hypothetical protein
MTDNRVEIPLDLTDEELLVLFKQAHYADVTFNVFIEQVLTEFLENAKHDSLLNKLDGPNKPELVPRTWPYPS